MLLTIIGCGEKEEEKDTSTETAVEESD